jgi:S-adenosylmethionine synthetase
VNLFVRSTQQRPPGDQDVEVVERKGLGHPDTICDGVAEHVSRALCREYLDRFGTILHHNVDKVLLVGGAAQARFGGGDVGVPIEIYLAGRATADFGGERIDVERIAVDACREQLRRHVRHLDVDRHVRIVPRLRPGSTDLTSLFARGSEAPLANDTSCGAGFAPLSGLERIVLAVETALNADASKRAHPAVGEDIKIMGIRTGRRISLTIGCAFVGAHVRDIEHYVAAKAELAGRAVQAARAVSALPVDVEVNAADDVARGDVFLTVTGTSAESGDDGEVGRGNRANGLITPFRPMTLEAAAGKNPRTHVGKLYNVLATRLSETIVAELSAVASASCVLVSRIGRPVREPQVVDVRLTLADGVAEDDTRRTRIQEIVADGLDQMDTLRRQLVDGTLPVY